MQLLLLAGLVASSCAGSDPASPSDERPPNVLFLIVDDLRSQLEPFTTTRPLTPRIDELAAGGVRFTRAYCQQALCTPSRSSVLTGRRPDTTRVYDVRTHFRDALPDVVTLPQHFKNNGYTTLSLGKVYHGELLDERSWSEPAYLPDRTRFYATQQNQDRDRPRRRGPPTESADLPDDRYQDGALANYAIEALRRVKDGPFFLAVGFYKPHLPFVAPSRYWDLFPEQDIALTPTPAPPRNAPALAGVAWYELRKYLGMPQKGPMPDDLARQLIHGYLASTAFVDAQVGKVLDELERLRLDENTIVVLWSDHGWYLGDHGLWTKMGTFEQAMRAPLIVRAPGQATDGAECDALVELVDLFPTLSDLAGLPACDGVQADSFAPLLRDPQRPWKRAAFGQHPIPGRAMGYSMRTDRYRFTSWRKDGDASVELGVELYDHLQDPGETTNLAGHADQVALVDALREQLDAGWRGARPK